MKHTAIWLLAATIFICSCSEGAKKPTTVTPVATTKLADIIFKKSNGSIDSFHIELGSAYSDSFFRATSDSFKLQAFYGNNSTHRIDRYEISPTALNSLFKGISTISLDYYSVSPDILLYVMRSSQSDTSNKLLGTVNYNLSKSYSTNNAYVDMEIVGKGRSYYLINRVDTVKVASAGADTSICVLEYNNPVYGTYTIDKLSQWILESISRTGSYKFYDYASYLALGSTVSEIRYYNKSGILTASYHYTYGVDSDKRIIQKTITSNTGSIDIVYYKYK